VHVDVETLVTQGIRIRQPHGGNDSGQG
jgi:hypothetical protein